MFWGPLAALRWTAPAVLSKLGIMVAPLPLHVHTCAHGAVPHPCTHGTPAPRQPWEYDRYAARLPPREAMRRLWRLEGVEGVKWQEATSMSHRLSEPLRDLLDKMLEPDDTKRLSLADVGGEEWGCPRQAPQWGHSPSTCAPLGCRACSPQSPPLPPCSPLHASTQYLPHPHFMPHAISTGEAAPLGDARAASAAGGGAVHVARPPGAA